MRKWPRRKYHMVWQMDPKVFFFLSAAVESNVNNVDLFDMEAEAPAAVNNALSPALLALIMVLF